jgi:superfamily II DNA or RNA helicase
LQEYKKDGYFKFLVLVPTISLAQQWELEIKDNFKFYNIIQCNSNNPNWDEEIRDIGRSIKLNKKNNYCILTTYATFRSLKFSTLFNDFFKSEMSSMTLIADEAHTFGSQSLLNKMPYQISKRLGLSATPDRQFDEIGGKAISDYFNSYPPNFTFSYNMKKAIEDKVLCRYYYYPKFVDLNQEELNEYIKISKKLMQYFDFETGRYKENDYVNQLLIKRKNIIHKANNKSNCLVNIVNEIGPLQFNRAFIYVPEGYEQNFEIIDIDYDDYILCSL